MMTNTPHSHEDWNRFDGKKLPGTFSLHPIFFEKVQHGDSIIDIGCGTGRICFDLLHRGYGPITGIDQNEGGIEFARETLHACTDEERKRCRFEHRSALTSGFDSHTFDAGLFTAVFTTLTTPQIRLGALREARRILKPGGGLYIGEFMQTWHHPLYYERYIQGLRDTGELGSFLGKDQTGTITFQAHHFAERELVDLLHEAGFQIEHWHYETVATQNGNTVNGVVIWAMSTASPDA